MMMSLVDSVVKWWCHDVGCEQAECDVGSVYVSKGKGLVSDTVAAHLKLTEAATVR